MHWRKDHERIELLSCASWFLIPSVQGWHLQCKSPVNKILNDLLPTRQSDGDILSTEVSFFSVWFLLTIFDKKQRKKEGKRERERSKEDKDFLKEPALSFVDSFPFYLVDFSPELIISCHLGVFASLVWTFL